MREIYYWSKAKHQNIQELMGVIMFQGRLGMVSLWMDHGNLREYIGKYPDVDRYSLVWIVCFPWQKYLTDVLVVRPSRNGGLISS